MIGRKKPTGGSRTHCKRGHDMADAPVNKLGVRVCRACARIIDREKRRRFAARALELARTTGRQVSTSRDRASHLRRKYGLTELAFEALLAAQGGACPVCGIAITLGTDDGTTASIDMDPATRVVRGVLCRRCSNALGLLAGRLELAGRLVAYLAAAAAKAAATAAQTSAPDDSNRTPVIAARQSDRRFLNVNRAHGRRKQQGTMGLIPALAGYFLYKNRKKIKDKIAGLGDEAESTKLQREQLAQQGQAGANFANTSEGNFQTLGVEAYDQREQLRRLAMGQDSLSREQLRQGLQSSLAGQRSMAAGASPNNQAMAARTAMINAGRMSAGMNGQAALAGIQERSAANQQLSQMIMGQRQQELQGALGSRQNAISGFGGGQKEGSDLEKALPAINVGAGALGALLSDKRAKTGIASGDDAAARALEALHARVYKYKDPRDGAGQQLGVMAQDLERSGLRSTVRDTPRGKMVDGAKLAGANTAMLAALARKVGKLERARR